MSAPALPSLSCTAARPADDDLQLAVPCSTSGLRSRTTARASAGAGQHSGAGAVEKSRKPVKSYPPKKMDKSARWSEVMHQDPHPSTELFCRRSLTGPCSMITMTHRDAVHPTQGGALRAVLGAFSCALRDMRPRIYARGTRDWRRQRLLSLQSVWDRPASVAHRSRALLPESHSAEATGSDDAGQRLDDPFSGFGTFRSPA
jgi:hypothetical protein